METAAFVIGPLGGVVIVPITLSILVGYGILRRRRWPLVLGGVLAMVFTVSTWLYWRAFWADGWFVDPETPPATQISVLEDVALGTAAGASVVMLVSTVITTTVFASRPRSINGTE